MSVRNASLSIYYGNIDAHKWSLVSVNRASYMLVSYLNQQWNPILIYKSLRILWIWSLLVFLLTPSRRLRSLLKLIFRSHPFIHKSPLELTLSCAIRMKTISSINLIISKPSTLRSHIWIKPYSFLLSMLARSTFIIYISYNKLLQIWDYANVSFTIPLLVNIFSFNYIITHILLYEPFVIDH